MIKNVKRALAPPSGRCINAFLTLCWLQLAAVGAASTNLSAVPGTTGRVLTNVAEFYALPQNALIQEYPVRLRVVATYNDPAWNMFQCQDESGALYIPPFPGQERVKAGDSVDIEGAAVYRKGAWSVDCKTVRVLKSGSFPKARVVGAKDIIKGGLGGLWIETQGLVRVMQIEERLMLTLLLDGERVQILVLTRDARDVYRLLDATVRVRGVASGKAHVSGQPEGEAPDIYVEGMGQIEILAPAPGGPDELPVTPISTALKSGLRQVGSGRRVHFHGVVNRSLKDALVIQDPTGEIKVLTARAKTISVDDRLSIQGFLALNSGELVVVDPAIETAGGPLAVAQRVSANSRTNQASAGELKVLKSIGEILDLTTAEAGKGYPVHFKAVATSVDPEWAILFAEDADGGVFIANKGAGTIRSGDELEVRGTTLAGSFQPSIDNATLTVLRSGIRVEPQRVSLKELLTGGYDCRWVETEGMVRSMKDRSGHLLIGVAAGGGLFEVIMPGFQGKPLPTNYLGAKVQVRGACGMQQNPVGQSKGVVLHVPSTNEILVLAAAPADPFSIPARRVAELLRYRPHELLGGQAKVRGVATLVRPRGAICLQDETGGVLAEITGTNRVDVGAVVEVVGYPEAGPFSCRLEDAVCRVVGAGGTLRPLVVSGEQILTGRTNDMELVQINGRLLEDVPQTMLPHLVLQDGSNIFSAFLERSDSSKPLPLLRSGSLLRLTGVCAIESGVSEQPRSFQILLRSIGDIVVLKAPPLLTSKHAIALAGVLGLATAAASVWVFTLRRVVKEQSDLVRQKLRQEATLEKRYRELFENASDIIFTIGFDGAWISLNKEAERVFGWNKTEILNTTAFDLIATEHHQRIRDTIQQLLDGKPATMQEVDIIERGRRRIALEVSAWLLMVDDKPGGLVCIARNVTERKRAEEEKTRLETQVRQAQKMEAIGTLAGGIAHDFNNILGIIIPYTDLAKMDAGDNPAVQESLSQVMTAAGRATDLVKQILTFSRQAKYERKPVFLQPVLKEVIKMLRSTIPSTIEIVEKIHPNVPRVAADVTQIHQVLMNLCTNASHAMRGTIGRMEVELGLFVADEAFVRDHPEMQPGNYAKLGVSDTGHGMDPETLKHAFEPFFSTKGPGEGTGLGLAVVHGIVEAHKGAITVSSEPGRGTVFTLFFPSCDLPQMGREPRERTAAPRSGNGERILYVDDESLIAGIAKKILVRVGYQVTTHVDPVEALAEFGRNATDFDLVVTDLTMPRMTGVDLAKRILEVRPDIPIILATGFNGAVTRDEILRMGIWGMIQKPVTPFELTNSIDQALHRRHDTTEPHMAAL